MSSYQRAVPVLQVADVERGLRWYADVLGFAADTFPDEPPYTFAILRRDGAELMLQCSDNVHQARRNDQAQDAQFQWSVYLRTEGATIIDLAASIATKATVLRGPEKMFYGLVEIELCDPDGYRVCVSGHAPPGVHVPPHEER